MKYSTKECGSSDRYRSKRKTTAKMPRKKISGCFTSKNNFTKNIAIENIQYKALGISLIRLKSRALE